MTKLELLLEEIDPKQYRDEFLAFDKVKSEFRRKRNRLEENESYTEVLVEFIRDIWRMVFGEYYIYLRTPNPVLLNTAITHLEKEFPNKTEKIVSHMMETGLDGGLYKIFQILADKTLENIIDNENQSIVSKYLRSLTEEEKILASKEYIQKYYNILPIELRIDVMAVYLNFQHVLLSHTKMIWGLRDIK